jgi:GNAT superfamily N-acetyltransferase
MDRALTVEVFDHDDPARQEYLSSLGEQLVRYHRFAGCDYRELHAIIRDGPIRLLGGLLGATHSGWLSVEFVWVAETLRKAGYGSRLLAAAEQEAVARGCTKAHLEATGREVVTFFLNRGYNVCGELTDYLPGQSRYWLRKELSASASS